MNAEDLELGLFDEDLVRFFDDWNGGMTDHISLYKSRSFRNTVLPMYAAHGLWKANAKSVALANTTEIEADDWRLAAQNWMNTRLERQKESE